jgi:hypothetical protein
LRAFENRVLRGIFEPKREEVDAGEDCIMRGFVNGMRHHTRMYPKVSGLAAWNQNCKW